MNLLRLIAIALVIWLLIRLIQRYRAKNRLTKSCSTKGNLGVMVECAHCKLHIPRQEAVKRDQKFYCSRQHAAKDRN